MPATDSLEPLSKQHFPALDGVRACAALMVFIQHYILSLSSYFWQFGWAGVNIFFVLSGFLITGILFDTKERPNRFKNFYARRTLRIFPLYYGVLLLLLLLTPALKWSWNASSWTWIVYLGDYTRYLYWPMYLCNPGLESLTTPFGLFGHPIRLFLGHFWSLAYEEQFYLLWPFVVYKIGNRRSLLCLCVAVALGMPCLRMLMLFLAPQPLIHADLLYRCFPFQIDSLLLGGALALAIRGEERKYLATLVRLAIPAAVLYLLAGVFLLPRIGIGPSGVGTDSSWMSTFGITAINLLSASAIYLCLSPRGMLSSLMSIKPLTDIGKISYGFYVFHDIPRMVYWAFAIKIAGGISLEALGVMLLFGFFGTILLSLLSYRLIESPFLRMKSRFVS